MVHLFTQIQQSLQQVHTRILKLNALAVLLIFLSGQVFAQVPTYYNNNTASPSNIYPWAVTSTGKGVQNYFPANSITGAYNGLITKIYYKVTPNVTTTFTDLTIQLAQTTNTSLDVGAITTSATFTTVYTQASATLTSNSSGWLEFTLATPYPYDPNLALISYVFNCNASNSGMNTCNYSPGSTPSRTYINNNGSCSPVYVGQDGITAAFGIDMMPATPCAGKPDASYIVEQNACPNVNKTLNLFNPPFGNGYTFEWYESTNGTTFNLILGANNPTHTININQPTYYYCIVGCTFSGQTDTTPIQLITINNFYQCYCNTSYATSATNYDIGKVQIVSTPSLDTMLDNGNDQPSTNNASATEVYTDYTGLTPAQLYLDSSYQISVSHITTTNSFTSSRAATYIDLNRDGVYDPNELMGDAATGASTYKSLDTFSIPPTAQLGLTGMRVILMPSSTTPDPCQTYSFGETEDYLVEISHHPCTGPLQAGIATAGDSTSCIGYPVVLTDTTHDRAYSLIEWEWEYSPDNYVWGTMANTKFKDTVHSIFTGTTYYRMRMICKASGDTTYSNVVKIKLGEPYQCYCYSLADGQMQDSSDVGTFIIKNHTYTIGGPHVLNPGAIRSRTDNTRPPYIELLQDSTYEVSVYHVLRSANHGDAKVTLFIDYDNSMTYDAPQERVLTAYSTATNWYVKEDFTIPTAIIMNQPTGMRLILNNNVSPNNPSDLGCGTYTSGETEDYVVILRPSTTSGINPYDNVKDLSVYPNPTQGELQVSLTAKSTVGEVEIRVSNITGQEVMHRSYREVGRSFNERLDIGEASNGMYFIELTVDGQRYSRKVMLTK